MRRRNRITAVGLGLFLMAAAATRPAQAGLLDFLFGRPTPAAEPAPGPAVATPPKVDAAAMARREAAARKAREATQQALDAKMRADNAKKTSAMQADDPGALDVFAGDGSLRAGDIVVTRAGFLVFQGRAGAAHTLGDFRPYAALDKTKRKPELVALETATRVAFRNEPPALTVAKAFRTVTSEGPALREVAAAEKPALRSIHTVWQ